jgi:hypothetical protein
MIRTPDEKFTIFYDSLGRAESANCTLTGSTVWVRDALAYDPVTNPLTSDFLAQEYDLSDRPDLAIPEIMP